MVLPKTAKGFISMMRRLEEYPLAYLKGFEKLTKAEQEALKTIMTTISNEINEV